MPFEQLQSWMYRCFFTPRWLLLSLISFNVDRSSQSFWCLWGRSTATCYSTWHHNLCWHRLSSSLASFPCNKIHWLFSFVHSCTCLYSLFARLIVVVSSLIARSILHLLKWIRPRGGSRSRVTGSSVSKHNGDLLLHIATNYAVLNCTLLID